MKKIRVSEEKNLLIPNSVSFDERKLQLEKEADAEKEMQKRAQKSPFSRWTQFNLEHTEKMMWLQLKHPKAAAIMSFLVDQMDEYNAVMCSVKVLQEVLEVSRQTISKNLAILKDNGYIAVLKSGSSNIYAINDTVYWKSWGNNKQYSKFPASIVLSLSEQEESLQTKIKNIKHKEIQIKGEG